MQSLYEYILESHGVVTGVNSWTRLVQHISLSDDNVITNSRYLAPWMASVTLHELVQQTADSAYASYDDGASKLVDDKMAIVIDVSSKVDRKSRDFKSILHHELQHAFDDWITRTKRGGYHYLSDRYQIGTGGEMEETSPFNVLNTKDANCDDVFNLLKYCTYFFEPTELNAYSREFEMWLKGKKEIDLARMMTYPHDLEGTNPLAMIHLLVFVRDHMDEYTVDSDHMDWDYIAQIINMRWAKIYLGSNAVGSDGKQVVKNAIKKIFDRSYKQVYEKYRKIIDHRAMQYGLKVKAYPEWWKKKIA